MSLRADTPASSRPGHPRSPDSPGRGAPGAAAPCRAEGGAREGARDGKGERAASNAWNNSASVWKASPAAARRGRPAPASYPAAMATSPQKSPSVPKSPTPKSPPSRKKDDSFLGKLGGTLARRKKAKEGRTGRGREHCGDLGVWGWGTPWQCRARLALSPWRLQGPGPGWCPRQATDGAQGSGDCGPRTQAQPVPCALR